MKTFESTLRLTTMAATGFALAAASFAAQAGVMLQAATASTTLGRLSGSMGNPIDQSGLIGASNLTPLSHVCGADDFDAFIAQGPRHGNSAGTTWASSIGVDSGRIVFVLRPPRAASCAWTSAASTAPAASRCPKWRSRPTP